MRIQVKPIKPKGFPTGKDAEKAIEATLDDGAQFALELYKKTASTWETAVTFAVKKTKYGRSVGTRSRIYAYVDKGTRPHTIKARRVPVLRFTLGGRPKTRQNYIASYKGSKGKQWVSKKEVHHPGSKPRNFTAVINTRTKQFMARRANQAMRELKRK